MMQESADASEGHVLQILSLSGATMPSFAGLAREGNNCPESLSRSLTFPTPYSYNLAGIDSAFRRQGLEKTPHPFPHFSSADRHRLITHKVQDRATSNKQE